MSVAPVEMTTVTSVIHDRASASASCAAIAALLTRPSLRINPASSR
jgi:hypothetical protein